MRTGRRILVLRTGALGDSVLTLPLLESIRNSRPSSEITVIGPADLGRLAEDGFHADRFFPVDGPGFSSFFLEGGELDAGWVEVLRGTDEAFNLINDDTLSGNLLRAGVKKVSSPRRGEGKKRHASDELGSVFPHYSLFTDGAAKLRPGPEEEAFAEEFWRSRGLAGFEVAAVHPGSGSVFKNWPAERFAGAALRLARSRGMKILFTHGEADGGLAEEFPGFFPPGMLVPAGGISVNLLGAVLGRCRIFMGNDSGPSHLAAASGTGVVCVFGPTDPEVWAPRGRVRVVRSGAPCSPCSREKMRSCRGRECLGGVPAGLVAEEAERMLSS